MKFKKITNDPKDLPPFEAMCVLLSPSKEGKFHAHIGYLKAIEKDGPVFIGQDSGSLNRVADELFGFSVQQRNLYPFTHWSLLEIDELETKEENVVSL